MNQRAKGDGVKVSLASLFPQEQGVTHLPVLSAYTQWEWQSPKDGLARSEGEGSAAGTPEAVGAAAGGGCAPCPPLAPPRPRLLPPRPLVPPLTAAMLAGTVSSALVAATVPPFAAKCTEHSLSAWRRELAPLPAASSGPGEVSA
jgi:hypothetical protein